MTNEKNKNNEKENTFINKSINLIKDRKFDEYKAEELLDELEIGGIAE